MQPSSSLFTSSSTEIPEELPQNINSYWDEFEIYLIFEDHNNAHILWSKNVDIGDIPRHMPRNLAAEERPGAIDTLSMSKLCQMQLSYRWQPHLPFMPVTLESHPWAKRYRYKYDTLPIVRTKDFWTLEYSVCQQWWSHVNFFAQILSSWRHHLAMAPMSVDYIEDPRDMNLNKSFDTERQARGYFWYRRTMIFAMFAEFSFAAAGRLDWRGSVKEALEDVKEDWLDALEDALCDFQYTKRSHQEKPKLSILHQ